MMKRFLMLSMMCVCMMPSFAQRVDFNLEGRSPKHVTANVFQKGIIVTISGLNAGSHSLLAYHNSVSTGKAPVIDVYVDGVKKLENVEQTSKALRATDAGQSYITFNAKKGKDVVITYRPQSETEQKGIFSSSLCINALVLDETNPKMIA